MADVTVALTGQGATFSAGSVRAHVGRVPEGYNMLPELLDYLKAQPPCPVTEWAVRAITATLSASEPDEEMPRAFGLRKHRGERNKSGPQARTLARTEEIARYMHRRIAGAPQRWGSVAKAQEDAGRRFGITPDYAGLLYRNWRKK